MYLPKVDPSCASWHEEQHNREHMQRLFRKQDLTSAEFIIWDRRNHSTLSGIGCRSISPADPFYCPAESALLSLFFSLPLLLSTTGSSPLATAVRSSAALPGQPVEPKEHEEDFGRGPEPPVLADREEHVSLAESRWLLTPLLLLLQEPSHLLGLLLLLCDIFFLVTHLQYSWQDAQHHQYLGDVPSMAWRRREGAQLGWVAGRRQLGQYEQETQDLGMCVRGDVGAQSYHSQGWWVL